MKNITITEKEVNNLLDMVLACNVFKTPIERRKHWNEYKEDASDRLREGLDILTDLKLRSNIAFKD